MKSSKKLTVSLLALGLLSASPFITAQEEGAKPAPPPAGQGGGPGGGQRGQRGGGGMMTVESLETAVGKLTDEQKVKIGDLLTKARKDVAAMSQEDRQAKGREMMQGIRKDIRALLTEEQQKKFDAMPQGRGPGGPGGQRRQRPADGAAPGGNN